MSTDAELVPPIVMSASPVETASSVAMTVSVPSSRESSIVAIESVAVVWPAKIVIWPDVAVKSEPGVVVPVSV